MVSVRDALYDMMWDDAQLAQLGPTAGIASRLDILIDDVHPTTKGSMLYGSIAAYGLRSALALQLAALADASLGSSSSGSGGDGPAAAAVRLLLAGLREGGADGWLPLLPQPVSPLAAQQADADTFCVGTRQRHVCAYLALYKRWMLHAMRNEPSVWSRKRGTADYIISAVCTWR
jgi:hypothetical protein